MEKNVRKKVRIENEKKYLISRLKIIEGQIKGVMKMVEEDRYCSDILIQISAINNSLKGIGSEILKQHLKTCVSDEIKKDNLEIIDEVMNLIKRLS